MNLILDLALDELADLMDVALLTTVHERRYALHRSSGRPRRTYSADWIHLESKRIRKTQTWIDQYLSAIGSQWR